MIGSGIKRFVPAAAIAALLLASPFASSAQETKGPVPLIPPKAKEAPAKPVAPPPPAEALPTLSGGPIKVNELSKLDPDSLGVLTADSGGFDLALWKNTTHETVAKLLPQTPFASTSPAMHDVLRRLLLTAAAVPAPALDAKGKPKSKGKPEPLLPMRVAQLVGMGETRSAQRLLEMLPSDQMNEELTRARVTSLLVEAETDTACAEAAAAVQTFDTPFWQKVVVYCYIKTGDIDRASLSVDLLREGGHDDPAFFAAVDSLLGASAKELDSLPEPTPLHIALLAAAKRPLPQDVLANATPVVLRTIALNADVDITLRARAAEMGVGAGFVEPDRLGAIYKAFQFTAAEFKDPVQEATPDKGVRAPALLYHAASVEKNQDAKAKILGLALDQAYKDGLFFQVARGFAPLIAEVSANSRQVWFAGRAARALFAAGNLPLAQEWVSLVKSNSFTSSSAAASSATLWPLARLAEHQWDKEWPKEGLREWNEAQREVTPQVAAYRRSMLLNLFAAFEEPIDPTEWEDLLISPAEEGAAIPNPALWHGLEDAAKNERVGQALLITLITLGVEGPSGASTVTLQHVVTQLRKLGLDSVARQFALEAALAAGA